MNTKRRISPVSLRLRLTCFISIVTIVIFLLTSGFVERAVEQHFVIQDVTELDNIDYAIQTVVTSYQKALTVKAPETIVQEIQRVLKNYPHHYVIWLANSTESAPIYQSRGSLDWQTITTQASAERVQIWQHDNAPYRLLTDTIHTPSATYLLRIATPIQFHLHFLQQLNTSFLIITIISSVILLLAAGIAVHQGHAPLRRLSQRIANLTTDELDTRLDPAEYPVELRELTQSFNRLIERIEDVFQRQANFSADIAHEIRTPITNLTTQTQIVLSKPRSKDDYQEILYSNLEEYDRMRKMVNDMLFLAQADSQLLSLETATIHLQKEWEILFDDFAAWAEEQHLTLALTGKAPEICGDRAMLRRAFSNLLTNAIHHTKPHEKITVDLSVDAAKNVAIIRMMNPHERIPDSQLTHLFDRFYRVDPARRHQSDSTGIGLAIVKSIIHIHDGKITVTSTENSVCFTIYLPLTDSVY